VGQVKVSVITASWNRAAVLRECLDSVASQRHPAIEHLVVDGGSQDGTLELLRERSSQLARWVSEPDKGIYDALNKGVRMSTGDVVGFLHADDVFNGPQVLSRVADAFSDPAVSAVYGDLQYVQKNDLGKVVRHWKSCSFERSRLAWGWMPPHPTLYVRRSCFETVGLFDTGFRIAADYDFILRLCSSPDFKAVYLPEVLIKMRVGGASNRSLGNIWLKSREDLRALRSSGVGGLGTLVAKNLSKLPQFWAQRRSG
jgi:glycosyltransferase involved in cell wall biosynthesis